MVGHSRGRNAELHHPTDTAYRDYRDFREYKVKRAFREFRIGFSIVTLAEKNCLFSFDPIHRVVLNSIKHSFHPASKRNIYVETILSSARKRKNSKLPFAESTSA